MKFKQCAIASADRFEPADNVAWEFSRGRNLKTSEHLRLAVATSTKFISRYLIHAAIVWLCFTLYLNIPKKKETCLLQTVQMFLITYSMELETCLEILSRKVPCSSGSLLLAIARRRAVTRDRNRHNQNPINQSIFVVTSPGKTPPPAGSWKCILVLGVVRER